ncbi:MAG: hypothetical protein A2445_05650 [Candidatus Jacksonbacteria bacterium RIFOXYC2_FULL_44_29]|nr:MAG: hypothetical protein A2445_05650 [Candidatus Jacksonbacteria bacterium RIFOXYC2_FULL_44_29]OGY82110.1 MAG: hypothetical protein A2550_00230 [Candidatus Jacksonbacteria bacterium RIFOXYD2_FULL_43_21]
MCDVDNIASKQSILKGPIGPFFVLQLLFSLPFSGNFVKRHGKPSASVAFCFWYSAVCLSLFL